MTELSNLKCTYLHIISIYSTEITESPIVEEEENIEKDFWDQDEIQKMVRYVAWNYYYKYLPHFWLFDYLTSEDAEPYFLWKMFK